ncbi:adenine nucleotide translocase lysine N-methyltransferase [Neosynchiropus ocellatus]
MSDSDSSKSEVEMVKQQNKRKRKEVIDTSDEDGESKTKKQRRLSGSLESLSDKDHGSEKSDEETVKSEKLATRKSDKKSLESSSDEEKSDDEKISDVKKSPQSGDEDKSGNDDESKKDDKKETSDDENEEKEEDSDSSSLPSLDDDKEVDVAKTVAQKKSNGKEEKSDMKNKEGESASETSSGSENDDDDDGKSKKKQGAKKKSEKAEKTKGSKEDNKSVVRLKRYISLCGVRRNYKKILGDCRSIQAMVAVLKKELEDLGVKGQPSIQKCKKVRMKREEARELAELNSENIIHTEGRASRRGTASVRKQEDSQLSTYKRAMNSSSGSDQENRVNGGRRKIDWSNLQGIISDDGDTMDDDGPEEIFNELKPKELKFWDVAQIAVGTGLAVYAMWAGILQPGFRKVPLKLQVPYIPASKAQVQNVMTLLKGRKGNLVDLGSGDGRIVSINHVLGFTPAIGYELNPWLVRLARFYAWRAGQHGKVSYRKEDLWRVDLTGCKNVTVFLAPSVLPLLQKKLHNELPDDAVVVAGRFPLPDWEPCRIEGQGVDRAWAYSMQARRKNKSQLSEDK